MKDTLARYALMHNGSRFARRVLQVLVAAGAAPELLILPGYAPARVPQQELLESAAAKPPGQFTDEIEIAYTPPKRQAQCARRLQALKLDFLLVACWPYLIDTVLVDSVSRLALNLHPSLLPRYRGPDPIGEQLARREPHPGVSLHLLSPQFDRGDVLLQAALAGPLPAADRGSLERDCATLGAQLFIETLQDYDSSWTATPQRGLAHSGI